MTRVRTGAKRLQAALAAAALAGSAASALAQDQTGAAPEPAQSPPPAPAPAPVEEAVRQAEEHLKAERYVEALASAQDAVRAAPNDFRAHYYVGMAYMGLREFDAADKAAAMALSQAPGDSRGTVEKLVQTLRDLRAGTGAADEAEAALREGLTGKAATLFEQSWRRGMNNPQLGFRAASLYASRLSQPVDAARVLRQIRASAPESTAAEQATAELRKLAPTLEKIAAAEVARAQQSTGEPAFRALDAAEAAFPDYAPLHQTRAAMAARANDFASMRGAVLALARRNLAGVEQLAALPRMDEWLERPEFATFISEVVGPANAAALAERTTRDLLKPNVPVPGELTSTDGALPGGHRYDRYRIRLQQGDRVRVELSSRAFDSYLSVGREGFERVNDDRMMGFGGLDSAVSFTAPVAGYYNVQVRGLHTNAAGAYVVTAKVQGR